MLNLYCIKYTCTYVCACVVCVTYLYRSSGVLKASQLHSSHQLLKVEPMQSQGTKQTIVEMPLQPKSEFVPQLANSIASSSNFPSGSKYHKKHVPKYTAPFPSPTTSQPTSPVVRNDKKSTSYSNQPLLSSSTSKQVKGQIYDLNKMAGAIASVGSSTTENTKGKYTQCNEGWWNCLSLPSSNHSTLIGNYDTVTTNSLSVDPSLSNAVSSREISLPNLTVSTSTTSIMSTMSPRIASPTNVSPLGASKNRMAR